MADVNWFVLVVTAGAIGAGVSSVITALSAYVATRKQMEIKKMEVAVKLFEGKQAQVQFAAAGNPNAEGDFDDPAYSFLDYKICLTKGSGLPTALGLLLWSRPVPFRVIFRSIGCQTSNFL